MFFVRHVGMGKLTALGTLVSSPLTCAFSRLEEASVVRLLQSLVSLSDEGG